MNVDILNMQGTKVGETELPAVIFETIVSEDLMHQAFLRQMANAHQGTHDTKLRGEVAGGGKKPWRQKGTGRARQGSIRAAQWKGGGRIHTPHPRKYTQSMPRKMRQAALRSVLTIKAAESDIVIVDDMKLPEVKTRILADAMHLLVGDESAIILIPEKSSDYEPLVLSANNLDRVRTLLTGYLNIRDLLKFKKLVMPLAALENIKAHLG